MSTSCDELPPDEPGSPQSLLQRFDGACQRVAASGEPVSNAQKLKLYALYKQATAPETRSAAAPSRLNVKERAKWEAWHEVRALAPEQAMSTYVGLVAAIVGPAEGSSEGPGRPGGRMARMRERGAEVSHQS